MQTDREENIMIMGLNDIGASLPPGFRFHPRDEELVCHYLHNKIAKHHVSRGTLVEIDLHLCEPWQLPEVAKLNSNEWYFFSFKDRKYATGFRANRATSSGYWKATGKDRVVLDPKTGDKVGMRKTLVFYMNRAPNGTKTGWIMHEFRLENRNTLPKEDWVLCRVVHKGKSENNYKINTEAAGNHEASTSHSPLEQHEHTTHSNTMVNLHSVLEDDYLKLYKELLESPSNNILMNTHQCEDDDFGFLLETRFQEHKATTNYDNISFQENTNNSMLW